VDSVFSSSIYQFTWSRICAYLAGTYAANGGRTMTYSAWKAQACLPMPSVSMPLLARFNIIPPSSGVSYVAPRPQRVIIAGGTISAIALSRNGVTFDNTGQTSGVFTLGAGDQLQMTYTVAPTTMVGSDLQ